jgi:endonuclease/exonuclease/phosphatase (EEP) superfamily protein YafD
VPPTTRRRPAAPLARDLLLAIYPFGLLLITLAALLAPQRAGSAALAQVLAHYLFVPALLLIPFALGRGMVLLRMGLIAAAAAFFLVYPPVLRLPGPPPAAPGPELTVLQWNVFVGGVSAGQLRDALDQHRPDVVLLQEALWEQIADDPAIAAAYPHRLLRPEETAPSLAILSRLPIVEAAAPQLPGPMWDMPRVVWARLDLGGRTVTLVNAHPMPPRIFAEGCSPLRCYNTGPRDEQIAALRSFVEELRRRNGDPLILAGDMNVTEREPAYFDLAAGLQDAHRVAGAGFGASWRPDELGLSAGLIRIDYLFSDAGARPLQLTTDCSRRASDHCLLVGRFALDQAPLAGR